MTSDDRHGGRGDSDRPPDSERARDRAVSPVIGAILMFALLVTLLGVLQATAVPELTRDAEFQHNQEVRGDLIQFSGAVSRTAATGTGETVPVRPGLRYGQRLFLINPPPATGTLRTTDPGNVTVANAVADGETFAVWNGTARNFSDRGLVYRPSYNQYENAPRTVYRGGIVANEFEGDTLLVAGDSFVDGRRIDLTLLAGEYEDGGVDRVGVGTEPLSAPARTVTVTNGSGPVTVTVPTALPESRWEALLAEERHVTGFDCSGGPAGACGRLTVTLERGVSYELRLSQVGVGSAAEAPPPAYLTDAGPVAASVPAGTRERLVVEARDRFDNPVSGVEVDATVVSGPGTVTPAADRTGTDGRASVVYEAPSMNGTADVTVELAFGDGAARTVTYEFQVTGSGGGAGDGGGDPGSGDGTGVPTVSIDNVESDLSGNADQFDVTASATDPDGSLERVEFELLDDETGTPVDSAESAVSGGSDETTATLRASGRNRPSEYRIRVTVFDADGNTDSEECRATEC